jgi:hypothetical protein
MNWKRLLLRLWWDHPAAPLHKLLDRSWRRRVVPRRRARWSQSKVETAPADMPPDFTPAAAEALWPGAADRSWVAQAAARWPDLHAAARARAAAAAAGRFDLLGSGEVSVLDEQGRFRWHDDWKADVAFPADCLYLDVPICLPHDGPDIKIPWELSRFQHIFAFLWTEPDRYRDVFLAQWRDWLARNPVARGVNWACAMDVALRAVSWTAALAAWGRTLDEPTLRRMWAALATHGEFVRDNLEWAHGARTNHYFSDIVGLAVLGAVLQPYAPAAEWLAFAARELRREIQQQFARDGLNCECSTTYHRLMLELATVGWQACRVGGHDLGPGPRARLAAAYRAIATLGDSGGHVPLIGDNDSGRVFPLADRPDTQLAHLLPLGAALLDLDNLPTQPASPDVALLGGPAALHRIARASEPPPIGAALRESGLFVLGPPDAQMIVRCGPLSYRAAGTHKHLDQLSLTLSVAERPLIVDPGQFCYTPFPQWRDRFIDSRAHNTVALDDQPQCRFIPVSRMAYSLITEDRPQCLHWEVTPERVEFCGRHRGYHRLPGGGDHIRTVLLTPRDRVWTVSDELRLTGQHVVRWRFTLHPAVRVDGADRAWQLRSADAVVSLTRPDAAVPAGRIEPGWYAPAYGRRVETRVLVFEAECASAVRQTFVLRVEHPR